MTRRVFALFTAICLLFGLALGGMAVPAYAADEDTEDVPVLPEGWVVEKVNDSDAGKEHDLVVVDDPNEPGNEVLMFTQPTTLDSWFGLKYIMDPTSQVVTLEYRYKVDPATSGEVLLPSFMYTTTDGSRVYPALLRTKGGVVSYSNKTSASAKWAKVAELEDGKWHTVKHVVDIANKTCELYLDEKRYELTESDKITFGDQYTEISGVMFGTKSATKNAIVYMDDMVVTTGVPDEENLLEYWVLARTENAGDLRKTSLAAAVDSDDPSNNVLCLSQVKKRNSWYGMKYVMEPTSYIVTLEYRYKVATGTTGDVFLPSFMYATADDTLTYPLLLRTNGGTVAYSNATSGSAAWTTVDTVTLADGVWHTVKHVVDIANKTCELYLNGTKVELTDSSKFTFSDELTQISGVLFGCRNTALGTAYLDDMVVTVGQRCESVTFESTTLNIPAGAALYLKPVFNPADSYTRIKYSSSNESVATVDNLDFGLLYGAKEGTAVITATPEHKHLQPVRITVTVGALIQGTISVTTPDALALPVGGHEDLNASIAFEGNFIVDDTLQYKSSAPEVATVDEFGEIVAVGAGTAKITVYSAVNPGITKEITVTVSNPSVMKTIYVSPNGTGTGENAASPTTLDEAAKQIAAIDKTQMTGNIEVILADGYYYRTQALALTDAHGGSNLYSVVFKAAEGANPTIGGGVSFKGGFEESDIEGVYVYDLKDLGLSAPVVTRQMFVDNVRAIRARSEVVFKTVLENGEWLLDAEGNKIGLICDNEELLDIKSPKGVEFVTYNNWTIVRCRAESISEVDGRIHIIMEPRSMAVATNGTDYNTMRPNEVVYYENALELLDEGGEWFLDEKNQKLYYMPRAWEDINSVEVTLPILDNWDQENAGSVGLVTITGTDTHQQVQNIRFEGITFADTTWLRPNTMGHGTNQNNYLRDETSEMKHDFLADAAVTVRMANGIQFLDCTFTRLGINGINMYDGVQNSLVQGGHFYDVGGSAIDIGEPDYAIVENHNPTDPKMMMKNVDVLNNYIHDVSVDYSAAAISVGFAVNLDLCNNEIFNIPYSGFHIGYGWNTKREIYTRGLNVSGNFIHDYMHDGLYDGGGIYLNGNTSGRNIASKNYLKNQGEKHTALYADTGTDWWAWLDNVIDVSNVTKGPISGDSILWASGLSSDVKHDNQAIGNFYAGNPREYFSEESTNTIFENNTHVADPSNWPAEAQAIIDASGLEAAYAGLRNNQMELIVTNTPDDGVDLSLGMTFALQVSGTDGKDRPVDSSKAIIAYESLDESVATVDENGVITAVADGITTVRVHVVSNDIWDVVEISVNVGDDVTELKMVNVEDVIPLFENSKDQELVVYGVTESGRQVSFDEITWSVADETVATVNENGVLKVVGVGETTLTVTATKGTVTKTVTYNVVVKSMGQWDVDYVEDIFEIENAAKWHQYDTVGYFEITDGVKIDGKVTNGKTYTGRMFKDELLTFRLSVTDKGNWPSIVLRTPSNDAAVGHGGTGYIVVMGQQGIELHRFNGKTRTQFYGPLVKPAPILGPSITPNPLNDGNLHEIQVGARNEDDGVRLVLYIDGNEIFNVLDTGETAIREAGYFGLVGANGDLFVLEKMEPAVEEKIEVKHNLTLDSYIDFSFFVPKKDVAESGLTATIVQDRPTGYEDKTVTLGQAKWESYPSGDGVEYWRIRYTDIAAKEMTDNLTLTIQDASGIVVTETYSIAEYAKERIENSTNNNMKPLMYALLHYGAAAQTYFGYRTDALANAGLNASTASAMAAAAAAESLVKHNLTLESNIDFSFFVPKSAVAASGLTATVVQDRIEGLEDKTVTLEQAKWESYPSGGVEYWRIRYADIAAKEVGDTLKLTVSDGSGAVVTDSYSVLQYAQERVQNSTNENMKALMQALQTYGAAAQIYFNYQ